MAFVISPSPSQSELLCLLPREGLSLPPALSGSHYAESTAQERGTEPKKQACTPGGRRGLPFIG